MYIPWCPSRKHSWPSCAILAFMNDLPPNIPNSTVDDYSDEPTFSSSSHFSVASTELEVNLQHDMDKQFQWSDLNGMVLNADKTKLLLITGKLF